jgi:hypothetical protein
MSFRSLLCPIVSRTLLLSTCLLALAASASAQLTFRVTVDTSTIAGGTYYMEFTLSDGQVVGLGTPDTNNSAAISNFSFGGGAAGAVLPPNIGNASGSAPGNISLADGDPGGVADVAQAFTAGSSLSFDVFLTTNVDAGGVPEQFSFFLLDSSFAPIPTTSPGSAASPANAFVVVNVTSSALTAANVRAFDSGPGTPGIPTSTISAVAAPEPGSLALLLPVMGTAGMVIRKRKRRK